MMHGNGPTESLSMEIITTDKNCQNYPLTQFSGLCKSYKYNLPLVWEDSPNMIVQY
jgi:hypothetical protein